MIDARLVELSRELSKLAVYAEDIRRHPDSVKGEPLKVLLQEIDQLKNKFSKEDLPETISSPRGATVTMTTSDNVSTRPPESVKTSRLLNRQNITYSMGPRLELKGIVFDDKDPRKDHIVSTDYTIKHIDLARDDTVGVPISEMNLTYAFDEKDDRDYQLKQTFKSKPDAKYLPKSVDLRKSYGVVYNQQEVNNSIVNAIAGMVKTALKKDKNLQIKPDRDYILQSAKSLAEKGKLTARIGYKSVKEYGVSEDSIKGITDFRYLSVDRDINVIKKCLKDGYPVTYAMVLYTSFMSVDTAKSGKVNVPNRDKEHRCGIQYVCIVGYDDSEGTFIVANSWSKNWGNDGFCYVPYDYIIDPTLSGDFWTFKKSEKPDSLRSEAQ